MKWLSMKPVVLIIEFENIKVYPIRTQIVHT